MKIYCLLIFLLLFINYSCGRGKYFITNTFRNGSVKNMNYLELDSTYRFYLREVYKDQNVMKENILKSNVEKYDTANKIRIEVEYLLISWEHRNVIYISTIPDKYQHYYSSNHFNDTLINAYDFSTFHFGKIDRDGESISFLSKDEKKLTIWDVRPFISSSLSQKIFIREIAEQKNDVLENVILINKALEEPISFSRQNNFNIIFEYPDESIGSPLNNRSYCKLAGNRIYFLPIKHGFDLYFHFDRNIKGYKDSAIGFDYRRTRYSPVKLLSE